MNVVKIYQVELERNTAEERLERNKQMKLALANGVLRPRDIVGTGYKNGRAVAEQYLAGEIARYETIIQIMEEN